ncbi:hypothetical protein [uncultured Psychroserpens sp.]|uniref:TPR end-of-group domain-containing protein n=1 Tax=uncultured Psychroserpens sp. TaxID=255436 RepID=UPI00262F0B41|nr:hypothetical protein [uncultured Psychroserpens sp.]
MKKVIKPLLKLLLILIINTPSQAQHSVQVKQGNTTYTIMGDTTKNNFKATWAKMEGRYSDAAKFKIKAIDKGESKKLDMAYYDAACYYSLANDYKNAIVCLKKSIDNGCEDLGHLEYDKDLVELKKMKEWNSISHLFEDYYKSNNQEIAKLFAEDQKARLSGEVNENMEQEDSIRRKKVRRLLTENEINSAHDYYKAAFIFHHGTKIEDYKQAHELALIAYNKEHRHFRSPWLVAATKDRYLLKKKEKQWYGTQGVSFSNGKFTLNPLEIDTTAVSKEDRKRLNAPTIETIRAQIKAFKETN